MTIHAEFPCQHCQAPLVSDGEPVTCACGHSQMAVIVQVALPEPEAFAHMGVARPEGGTSGQVEAEANAEGDA